MSASPGDLLRKRFDQQLRFLPVRHHHILSGWSYYFKGIQGSLAFQTHVN